MLCLLSEFRRITTVRLQSSFMGNLDPYTPRLFSFFMSKVGAAKEELQGILEAQYRDADDNIIQEDLAQHVLKVSMAYLDFITSLITSP
ncbi:unnamed protein product [Coregonus sp. 'balchen']|nr:unnamed protein product [Coregonus sp. 'balchen']